MSTILKIAQNSIVLLVAQCIGYLLAFLYMMYSARYLGPAEFGILSFAIAFTSIINAIGDLGLQTLVTLEVARDKGATAKYLANISLMKILISVVVIGIIATVAGMSGYSADTVWVLYLLGLAVIFNMFVPLYYGIYQGHEKMIYMGIGQVLNSAIIFIGVVVAVNLRQSIVVLAAVYAIAAISVLIYNLIILRVKFHVPNKNARMLEFDPAFWKRIILRVLPFAFIVVFASVYSWGDWVLLKIVQGDAVVGWYSAASRLPQLLIFIPLALTSALYPIMSRSYRVADSALRLSAERSIKYLFIVGLPISIGVTLLADRIINVIFGPAYSPTVISLQILIWSTPLNFTTFALNSYLYATNRQNALTKMYLAITVFNLALNVILIPMFSYVGASAARVAADLALLTMQLIFISRSPDTIGTARDIVTIVRVAAAGLGMAAVTIAVSSLNLILVVAVSALVYFGLTILLRTFDKTDLSFILQLTEIFGRKKNQP
ncbi:MAG: flippase [Dehalococcoidia bacterium]